MINTRLFQLCLSVSMGLLAGVQAEPAAIKSSQLPKAPVVENPAENPVENPAKDEFFRLTQTLSGNLEGTGNLGANYGSAVALNGDYLFVAAANAAPNGLSNAGVLSFFKRDPKGNYVQSQAVASLLGEGDLLGSIGSVQSDGKWLFVAAGTAPFAAQEGAEARGGGLVQVYKLKSVNGQKTWVPFQQLHALDLSLGDNFGSRIALDAKAGWAFISAENQTQLTKDGTGALGAGAVYVYKYDITTRKWKLADKLLKPDGYKNPDTHFGFSLAVQGAHALIGSDNGSTAGNNGSVYAYTYICGKWVNNQIFQGDKPNILDPVIQGDAFGASISLDGDWAVISAPLDSTKALLGGKVYIFKAKMTTGVKTWYKAWTNPAELTNQNGFLGAKVLIDGHDVFISALDRSVVDNLAYAGAVHYFNRSGDKWTLVQTFGGGKSYSFAGADFAYSPSRGTVAVGSFSNLDYYMPQLPASRNFNDTAVAADPVEVKIFKEVK